MKNQYAPLPLSRDPALMLAIGLYAWVLLAPYVGPVVVWLKTDNNAPAWIQAIGSIAAIGVAIWVSWRQNKKHDEDKRRDRLDRHVEIALTIKDAHESSRRCFEQVGKVFGKTRADFNAQLLAAVLHEVPVLTRLYLQVPVYTVPAVIVGKALSMASLLERFRQKSREVEELMHHPAAKPEYYENSVKFLHELASDAQDIIRDTEQLVRTLQSIR